MATGLSTLALGSTGDDVVSLQLALVQLGVVSGDPTGQFDETTRQAVMIVQRAAKLSPTGVVDDATWNVLFSAQADAAPAADPSGAPTVQPIGPAIVGDQIVGQPPAGPQPALLLFVGVAFAAWHWWTHRDESEDEEEPEEDDEAEEEDDADGAADLTVTPMSGARARRRGGRRFRDVTTDSLIDEPAMIAGRGKPGDCKKATKLLMGRASLAQSAREKGLFEKVVRKVATDCRGAEEEIDEAIEEAEDAREEIENMLELRPGPRAKLWESGFRKSRGNSNRHTTTEHGDSRAKGRGRAGRPGAKPITVRKPGGGSYRMRKMTNKTKRGYTWRKDESESDDGET